MAVTGQNEEQTEEQAKHAAEMELKAMPTPRVPKLGGLLVGGAGIADAHYAGRSEQEIMEHAVGMQCVHQCSPTTLIKAAVRMLKHEPEVDGTKWAISHAKDAVNSLKVRDERAAHKQKETDPSEDNTL